MNDMKRPPLAKAQITVDVVIFSVEDDVLKVVLVRRDDDPFKGFMSLPGGFLWENETTVEAAERVLKTKAGVSNVFFEQLYTFDAIQRDPRNRIISITYFALVPSEKLAAELAAKDAELVPCNEAAGLAFDHDQIVAAAHKRMRTKLAYSNVAYSLLPPLFTLTQLQKIYEAILGHAIDKRNFRKKIMSLDIIDETNEKLTGQRNRPARLYKFKQDRLAELEEPIF